MNQEWRWIEIRKQIEQALAELEQMGLLNRLLILSYGIRISPQRVPHPMDN